MDTIGELRLQLPRRRRGRQTESEASEAEYQTRRTAFCDLILQIRTTVDFGVGSRGWCHILEQHGLTKDAAQALTTAFPRQKPDFGSIAGQLSK
jgi:hypothetical protein